MMTNVSRAVKGNQRTNAPLAGDRVGITAIAHGYTTIVIGVGKDGMMKKIRTDSLVAFIVDELAKSKPPDWNYQRWYGFNNGLSKVLDVIMSPPDDAVSDESDAKLDEMRDIIARLVHAIPNHHRGGNYGSLTCGVCNGWLAEYSGDDKHREGCVIADARNALERD